MWIVGEDPQDPTAVWKKLQDQFQKKTWANKMSLRKRLYTAKLKNGESASEHIRMMTEVFNELAVVGDPVGEADQVIYLLAGLPESYDMLVTAFETMETVPNWETVVERVCDQEKKKGEKSQEKALTSWSKREMVAERWSKREKRCFECGDTSHFKKDCPRLKDGKAKANTKVEKSSRKSGKKSRGGGKQKACKASANDSSDDEYGLFAHHALSSFDRGGWIVDSGATAHMCNNKDLFRTLRSTKPSSVTLGDGHSLKSTGVGEVPLCMKIPGGKTQKCVARDVLYVPKLAYNLFSISKASEAGTKTVFSDTGCRIEATSGKVIAAGSRVGLLYFLDCMSTSEVHVTSSQTESKEDVWHQRYGHLGEKSLNKLMTENLVEGLDYDPSRRLNFCKECVDGKIHRQKFNKEGKRSSEVLGLVHSDVCGKTSTDSLSGARYFLTFIDDRSRYTWVYILKTKDEVFEKFLEWKAMAEKSLGKEVKTLRTDGGGEYTSGKFEAYLKKEGIRHEVTIPKTPEQNGVAERMNRTLVEMARSMLGNMPRRYWAEAVSTAAYLRNRSPTSAVPGMTPFQALFGKKPDVSNLRPFGCICYAHVPKDERKKFDPKSRKCLFLGYGDCVKGHRLYDLSRSKVIHSRDVIFNEKKLEGTEVECNKEIETSKAIGIAPEELAETEPVDAVEPAVVLEPAEGEPADQREIAVRRSGRQRNPVDRYGEWVTIADVEDPKTYEEAVATDEKKWRHAMEAEMQSLKKNDVWELARLPKDRKVIGCKWVYKTKVTPEGDIERYKARLVAQGCSQKYGTDYDETFCPVVRAESVRSVIALAAQKKLMLHQMDVTTAFLNGELDEEVYIKQPDGFREKGKEDLVCRLKKSLYGLKQSSRCWNTALDTFLQSRGLVQSNADPCVYSSEEGEPVVVAIYVDDILIATETSESMKKMKNLLSKRFEVRDLGQLESFLGVKVNITPNGPISIGQPGYTKKILERFGMTDVKPVTTPVDVSQKLHPIVDGPTVYQSTYQSAVGSLLYLSNWTRPDITFAVNNVAKFMKRPSRDHWTAVKRIFRYLKGTVDYGIVYNPDSNSSLVGYSDADWAGDVNDRKSTSGYVFMLGGAPVSWRSNKQSCVALSTAEAEYIALAGAAQEAVWLRDLLSEVDNNQHQPTVIFDDSQSAMAMTRNPQYHGRAKHIDIKFHYIREQVERCVVTLKYCPTENMLADILTKGLPKEKHQKFCEMLQLVRDSGGKDL